MAIEDNNPIDNEEEIDVEEEATVTFEDPENEVEEEATEQDFYANIAEELDLEKTQKQKAGGRLTMVVSTLQRVLADLSQVEGLICLL
jgi:hypothetical protein